MPLRHRFRLPVATAALCALFLAACGNPINVRSDFDRSADYGSYRSYAFYSPLATDKAGYASLTTEYFKRAAQREMESRGYTYDPKAPDLLVNFNASIEDKTRVTTVSQPVMAGGGYGYRGGYYSAWPAYSNQTYVDQYRQGTVNVDVVDAKRQKLVWEGVAVGRVTKKGMEDPEAAIGRVMAEIYANYPFRAGVDPR